MSPDGGQYEVLEWDSTFFGFRIARITATRLDGVAAREILQLAKEESVECLYFLADPSDVETMRTAEEHGFRLVDTRITLELALSGGPTGKTTDRVRPAMPSDIPPLREIAGASHEDSRFFSDPHFPRAACQELFRVWIEKSCQGYADLVLVAEDREQPAGYLSCHLLENQSGRIGLLGIAREARGKGLARHLIGAALEWFAGHGVMRVSVVTQGRNIRAQRVYEEAGFVRKSLELWYHAWLCDAAGAPELIPENPRQS